MVVAGRRLSWQKGWPSSTEAARLLRSLHAAESPRSSSPQIPEGSLENRQLASVRGDAAGSQGSEGVGDTSGAGRMVPADERLTGLIADLFRCRQVDWMVLRLAFALAGPGDRPRGCYAP